MSVVMNQYQFRPQSVTRMINPINKGRANEAKLRSKSSLAQDFSSVRNLSPLFLLKDQS